MKRLNTRNIVLASAFTIIVTISSLILVRNGIGQTLTTIANFKSMLTTTLEERKGEAYKAYGYNYFNHINKAFPNPKFTPLTRYFDWGRNLTVMMPQKESASLDVMLAMDVEPDVFETNMINHLQLESQDQSTQTWTFITVYDIDTLQLLKLTPETCTAENVNVDIQIYLMLEDAEPASTANQTIPCLPGIEQQVVMDQEIKRFSIGRGITKFKVEITTDHEIKWRQVTAYGIKIDTRSYVLINNLDKNYTFISKIFLEQIDSTNDEGWKKFLEQITNV